MHPLELQVKDLKAIVEKKELRLQRFETVYRSIKEQLEEIKDMLHPSRQKHIEAVSKEIENALR